MITALETVESPVSGSPKTSEVACPVGLPCEFIRLMRVGYGGESFVLVCNPANELLAVLGNRLSLGMSNILERAQFVGPARRCKTLEGMLHCGYVMASIAAADWLTQNVRLLFDMHPHTKRMLRGGEA